MHKILIIAFGFPDFYGKNVNALIDCWSSLRFPEDEMTGFTIAKDEQIMLRVKDLSGMTQLIMNHFLYSVESVNELSFDRRGTPLIVLELV